MPKGRPRKNCRSDGATGTVETINNDLATLNKNHKKASAKCNKCHTKTDIIFEDNPTKSGGTRCFSCGTYDNFTCLYTGKDGVVNTFFTIFDCDKIKSYLIVRGKVGEAFKEEIENSGLTYIGFQNVLVKLGLNYFTDKLFYSPIYSEEDNNKMAKKEDEIVLNIKKMIKE